MSKKLLFQYTLILSTLIYGILYTIEIIKKENLLFQESVSYEQVENKDLSKILLKFRKDAQYQGLKIDYKDIYFSTNYKANQRYIGIEDSVSKTAGECVSTLFGKKIIILNIISKEVVYHELGHCILGLAHIEDMRSIMSPDLDKYQFTENDFKSIFRQEEGIIFKTILSINKIFVFLMIFMLSLLIIDLSKKRKFLIK